MGVWAVLDLVGLARVLVDLVLVVLLVFIELCVLAEQVGDEGRCDVAGPLALLLDLVVELVLEAGQPCLQALLDTLVVLLVVLAVRASGKPRIRVHKRQRLALVRCLVDDLVLAAPPQTLVQLSIVVLPLSARAADLQARVGRLAVVLIDVAQIATRFAAVGQVAVEFGLGAVLGQGVAPVRDGVVELVDCAG